ncbi:lysozyme inhibitor LprI family protein [Paraburkholderia phosphatilytica]|uniref:lysozyme inhibitor LprI family protein n=1 Tax=Paraburkholderia phosphatilytica TaxID=2282883 RepID=UPI000E4D9151|nr:lysozyme inhibitor LprI family protein [Paraburkholderia phosphatilytica]
MTRFFSLFVFLSLTCFALNARAQSDADEISQQSGIPASEVGAMLTHCDANQMSINMCAWRDRIVAERKLQRAVATKGTMNAGCPQPMNARIDAWKQERDQTCARKAQKQYGGGTMQQSAQTMCETAATKRMTGRINAGKCP